MTEIDFVTWLENTEFNKDYRVQILNEEYNAKKFKRLVIYQASADIFLKKENNLWEAFCKGPSDHSNPSGKQIIKKSPSKEECLDCIKGKIEQEDLLLMYQIENAHKRKGFDFAKSVDKYFNFLTKKYKWKNYKITKQNQLFLGVKNIFLIQYTGEEFISRLITKEDEYIEYSFNDFVIEMIPKIWRKQVSLRYNSEEEKILELYSLFFKNNLKKFLTDEAEWADKYKNTDFYKKRGNISTELESEIIYALNTE